MGYLMQVSLLPTIPTDEPMKNPIHYLSLTYSIKGLILWQNSRKVQILYLAKARGTWVAQSVKHLPSGQPRWRSGLAPPAAQGLILETLDESHVGLSVWSLLLPLPVSLPLSVSLMNK